MKDKLPQLKNLTDLFTANHAQYKGNDYDESNTRTDFIDKFFELLDWDVRNEQGFSENYREVIREDKVKIDGQQKAPDYCFRIGGIRKFFVEAKKPGVNIKDNADPAFQVRRYAYTAKLPLSILTNFEEFAVYDTRIKPDKNDKASAARIFYCTFREYDRHFDFIRDTFSKNAILKGSFDRYVEENKNKKGTTAIDEDLLLFVEDWRVELAKNIALRNPDIPIYNLNTVVQKTIDRILFLRIAESKGIEDLDLLKTVSQGINVYKHLNQLFINANIKYNSGLFKGETWIENVNIDDRILSNIIVNLYYPDCPYEFAVLPVEILGNIYEKFLGKTIRFKGVKGGHSAVIEEKPEVRKAGGVYYTPQYIVDYIVQNTVGVLIKDKTPDEIAALRFVDPACGSGSFLVGAYQYLLNYHLDYYTNEKNRKAAVKKEKIYEASAGGGHGAYKLTIAEKQQILQNNIYGVDIDSQAVEVTKLSLYLKLLENEGTQAGGQLEFDMALLPSLENNIKCGNSLIGTDFYTATLDFDDEAARKVNCFDWEKEFPEVFKTLTTNGTNNTNKNKSIREVSVVRGEFSFGGFDVVIGNPPYISVKLQDKTSKEYIDNRYKFSKNSDIYIAFFERAFTKLLINNGKLGYITPNKFFGANYGKSFRTYIKQNLTIDSVFDVKDEKVFSDAQISCVAIIFSNDRHDNAKTEIINNKLSTKKYLDNVFDRDGKIQLDINIEESAIIDKIRNTQQLQDCADVRTGVMGFEYWKMKDIIVSKGKINSNNVKLYTNGNLGRYEDKWDTEIALFKDKYIKPTMKLDQKYLSDNTISLFKNEDKIIVRGVSKRVVAFLDDQSSALLVAVHSVFSKTYSNKYLLGIINSKLINWLHVKTEYSIRIPQGSLKYPVSFFQNLPIPALDLSKKVDKTAHDKLVALVDKMLELKRKEHDEPNPQVKTVIGRQIGAVDTQIDKLVYELYNLSGEEIKTVEGESNG